MLEPARVNSVIELITACEAAWHGPNKRPSDIIIHHYFRDCRYIGSKDRAAIAKLTYYIIRNYAALSWWCMQQGISSPRALCIAALLFERKLTITELKSLFTGERHVADELSERETTFARHISKQESLLHPDMPDDARYNIPAWMFPEATASLGNEWQKEIAAMNEEAPVDLRANLLLTTRDKLIEALNEEGFRVEPTPHSPIGVRMKARAPIFTSKYFKQGWFEMQDEGSQLVSLMLDAKPGERIIDFCAGAGGKTLAVAAQMQNKGRILAWDTSENRINQMPERLRRAKVDNVQRHVLESEHDAFLKRHKSTADAVIIDAPCSGSGTWRRNPDLKWRSTQNDLGEIISVQQKILQSASRLVKVGGRLLYITCSILESENQQQIAAFLSHTKNFKVVTDNKICSNFLGNSVEHNGMLRLTPHKDGTDGFFAAMLQRVE